MLWRKYSGIEADFSERQAGRKISLTPATGKAHYLLLAGMMSTSFASAPWRRAEKMELRHSLQIGS